MEAQMEAVLSSLPAEKQQAVDALHSLMAGNRRFVQGLQEGCAAPIERRLELRESQSPCAIVITCSDSRCPPELLFDQGYGDIFVVRVAGNVVSQHVLGSISYALQHLHTRLILVLGHTNCGAIKASVADFVDSTTKRLREREEAEAEAAAAEAARLEDEQRHQAKESRTFFSRLFALFGGREEVARLVRTASFRDAEHAAAPINSIVLSIQPAVKDVVWALLTSPPEAIGAYAPLSSASSTCGGSTRDASSLHSSPHQSPCGSPRAGSVGGEGNWDGSGGGGGGGDGAWDGAALGGGKGGFGGRGWGEEGEEEEEVAAGREGAGMHQALDLPPCLRVMHKILGEREAARKIMADLKRNSSHWALCSSAGGLSSDGEDDEGEEGGEREEGGAGGGGSGAEGGLGHRHGHGQHGQHHAQHAQHGQHHAQHAQHGPWHPAGAPGEDDHHLAPLRWDCDALDGAITDKPEVCEHVLHQTLADPNVNICLHTALRCSKVVNSVIYQNVRRQGGEIWEAMRTWVDGGEMEHVIMATAVYDLASGRVDFFGLQTS